MYIYICIYICIYIYMYIYIYIYSYVYSYVYRVGRPCSFYSRTLIIVHCYIHEYGSVYVYLPRFHVGSTGDRRGGVLVFVDHFRGRNLKFPG